MRKLKLDPELLRVESFASLERGAAPRGTVDAHSYVSKEHGACSEPQSQYCQETDYGWHTCGNSCWYACFPSEWEISCLGC